MSLPECLKEYVGKWITSPRNEVFKSGAQRYLLKKMDNHGQFLELVFEENHTHLRVHYWRFNLAIDMLLKTQDEYVMVGTRINSTDYTTVQGALDHEAKTKGHVQGNMRMASFVCDLLVLCGYAEFGYMENPKTGRRVQGVRKTPKLG